MAKKDLETLTLKNFWAILLSDSQYRNWDEKDNYSKLKFSWPEFPISRNDSLTDINISVAQAYPHYDNEKVKDIAGSIYGFFKITRGDGVLGFEGIHVIDKLGIVTDEKVFSSKNEIELNINWVKDFKRTVVTESFFEKRTEILKLNSQHVEVLNSLSLPIKLGTDKYLANVSTLDNIYLKQIEPQKETIYGHSIRLFYGTNRNKTGSNRFEDFYGNELSTLKLGFCMVSIPKKHVPGEVERPRKPFGLPIFKEKLGRHVIIEDICNR